MEVLYKKLYDKYNHLKTKRFAELDQSNEDLEGRIQEYLIASDAHVEQLLVENDKLRAKIGDLQSESTSLRSAEDQQCEDSRILLAEERRKNEELTKEIDKLLKMQEEGKIQNQETDTPVRKRKGPLGGKDQNQETDTLARRSARLSGGKNLNQETDTLVRKRRRLSENASDSVPTELAHPDVHRSKVSELSLSISQENTYNVDHQQPQCCRSSNDSGPCNCLFQDLVDLLTGMKVSVASQSDRAGICVLHQSSGYSFELSWLKNSATGETEFMYQVSSLGTFERVAPEWMREAIIFSMSMCPVFFERVSRFTKHLK